MKKILIFLMTITVILTNLHSIEKKDYINLTDRDRILLAISYYEVSLKYKALEKNTLAESYYKEAQKIERNVIKYYSGELEIPPKTISINWGAIFEDDDSKKDIIEDNNEAIKKEEDIIDPEKKDEKIDKEDSIDKEKITQKEDTEENIETDDDNYIEKINSTVDSLIRHIKNRETDNAINIFTDIILIQFQSINITATELKETINGWYEKLDSNNEEIIIPAYDISIEKNDSENYKVDILFCDDINFFIPVNNRTLTLNIAKIKEQYIITGIYFIQERKKADKESIKHEFDKNTVDEFLIGLFNNLLQSNIDEAVDYFNKDIWFEEFNVLLSNEIIKSHFTVWLQNNSEIKDIDDILDKTSISVNNDVNISMFENWGIESSNYNIVSFKLKNTTLIPGNPDKSNIMFVLEKFEEQDMIKVIGISQY